MHWTGAKENLKKIKFKSEIHFMQIASRRQLFVTITLFNIEEPQDTDKYTMNSQTNGVFLKAEIK